MTDTTTPAPEQVEPDLPLPEDFNLNDWFAGVRPTVRSCTIYQRADLLADLEDSERRLQLVSADDAEEFGLEDGDSAEALNAHIDDLYRQLLDSGVTFKVEGRSAEWLTDIEKKANKANRETNNLSKDERAAYVTRQQLAKSILEPAGVTAEHLAVLEEVAGAQYRKLVSTFFTACSQAPVVSAPTSPSSSASRRGRGR